MSAAAVVIMIGRKRTRAASTIASAADMPCFVSASTAKSIIMIAFFFTRPMSMITPDIRVHAEILAEDQQREKRSNGSERKAGENRQRVDVALVQDAQHDVDHEDRHDQQGQQAALRLRKGLRVAGEDAGHVAGQRVSRLTRHRVDRRAERDAGTEVV